MPKGPIIALAVAALAVAVALALRLSPRPRAVQAFSVCPHYLVVIDSCKQEWQLEYRKTANDTPTWDDLRRYLPAVYSNSVPMCPEGGIYTIGKVGEAPKCSLGGPRHSMPK